MHIFYSRFLFTCTLQFTVVSSFESRQVTVCVRLIFACLYYQSRFFGQMDYKTDLCRSRLKSFNLSFVFREIINLSFYLEHTIIFCLWSIFEVSGRQNWSKVQGHLVGFLTIFLFGPSTFIWPDRTVHYIPDPEIEWKYFQKFMMRDVEIVAVCYIFIGIFGVIGNGMIVISLGKVSNVLWFAS